jgi:hypothetical protein
VNNPDFKDWISKERTRIIDVTKHMSEEESHEFLRKVCEDVKKKYGVDITRLFDPIAAMKFKDK